MIHNVKNKTFPNFFCQKIYHKYIIIIFLCFSYIIYSISGYFLLTGDFIRINRVNFIEK